MTVEDTLREFAPGEPTFKTWSGFCGHLSRIEDQQLATRIHNYTTELRLLAARLEDLLEENAPDELRLFQRDVQRHNENSSYKHVQWTAKGAA